MNIYMYIYIYSQQCDNARYAMEYITKKMPFDLCFQIGASPIGNTHTYLLHSGGHDDPTAPAVGLYRAWATTLGKLRGRIHRTVFGWGRGSSIYLDVLKGSYYKVTSSPGSSGRSVQWIIQVERVYSFSFRWHGERMSHGEPKKALFKCSTRTCLRGKSCIPKVPGLMLKRYTSGGH